MKHGYGSKTDQLKNAAVENPGKTAVVSLLTSPIALKASGVALRWARRNPKLAFVVAAGALAWYGLRQRRQAQGAVGSGDSAADPGTYGDTSTGRGSMYDTGSTSRASGATGTAAQSGSGSGSFGFPGAAHGSIGGYGSGTSDGASGRRSTGGDTSSASSL